MTSQNMAGGKGWEWGFLGWMCFRVGGRGGVTSSTDVSRKFQVSLAIVGVRGKVRKVVRIPRWGIGGICRRGRPSTQFSACYGCPRCRWWFLSCRLRYGLWWIGIFLSPEGDPRYWEALSSQPTLPVPRNSFQVRGVPPPSSGNAY